MNAIPAVHRADLAKHLKDNIKLGKQRKSWHAAIDLIQGRKRKGKKKTKETKEKKRKRRKENTERRWFAMRYNKIKCVWKADSITKQYNLRSYSR
jgi:hypothetical protein